MSPELFPLRAVTLKGIWHELDPSGSWCKTCGEMVEWLLESGGESSYYVITSSADQPADPD